jgi:NAD/NADP transhydrogenase beta subunit
LSASLITNIVVGLAVLVLLIVRQLRVRPVRENSAARIVLILGVIGIVEMVSAAKNRHVAASAIGLIVLSLVIAAGFGAWRAVTVRVWRNPDGTAWRQGTGATAALWIVAFGAHVAIDAVIGITDKDASTVASASILLYLAVSLGIQREVLRARAARLGLIA